MFWPHEERSLLQSTPFLEEVNRTVVSHQSTSAFMYVAGMYVCRSRDLSREISWRAWHSFFIPYWEPLRAFIVYSIMKERWSRLFFPELRVPIKDNNNSPHGKFHQFLFPFSMKFPDLNFGPYVLHIYHVVKAVRDTNSEPGEPVFIPVRAAILVKIKTFEPC